jgi:2'-5' RNA ligase
VSALYVDIPEAEPLVADARRRWDTAGSAVPAHVTILFPFLSPDRLDAASLAALAEVASTVEPFGVTFARHGRFPSVLWLAPEPAAPFRALTEAMVKRWPDHPPYGGAFDEVIHHLTVADRAPSDVMDQLADRVVAQLPISGRVDRLTLSVRHHGAWSLREGFRLGRAASEHPAGTKSA